jgi:hypothetical protein
VEGESHTVGLRARTGVDVGIEDFLVYGGLAEVHPAAVRPWELGPLV